MEGVQEVEEVDCVAVEVQVAVEKINFMFPMILLDSIFMNY
jgi:hypothetical protein